MQALHEDGMPASMSGDGDLPDLSKLTAAQIYGCIRAFKEGLGEAVGVYDYDLSSLDDEQTRAQTLISLAQSVTATLKELHRVSFFAESISPVTQAVIRGAERGDSTAVLIYNLRELEKTLKYEHVELECLERSEDDVKADQEGLIRRHGCAFLIGCSKSTGSIISKGHFLQSGLELPMDATYVTDNDLRIARDAIDDLRRYTGALCTKLGAGGSIEQAEKDLDAEMADEFARLWRKLREAGSQVTGGEGESEAMDVTSE
jgi:hypothetical protein